jgi:uncharacterized protein
MSELPPPPPPPPLPPNPYATTPGSAQPLSPSDEKTWATLTHVFAIFFSFIPALVLFLLFKDRGPFVRAHVVTEWNFQLTLTIVELLAFISAFGSFAGSFLAAATSGSDAPPSLGWFFAGYGLLLISSLLRIIFCLIATVQATRGIFYRIPIAIRFVKA